MEVADESHWGYSTLQTHFTVNDASVKIFTLQPPLTDTVWSCKHSLSIAFTERWPWLWSFGSCILELRLYDIEMWKKRASSEGFAIIGIRPCECICGFHDYSKKKKRQSKVYIMPLLLTVAPLPKQYNIDECYCLFITVDPKWFGFAQGATDKKFGQFHKWWKRKSEQLANFYSHDGQVHIAKKSKSIRADATSIRGIIRDVAIRIHRIMHPCLIFDCWQFILKCSRCEISFLRQCSIRSDI